MTSENSMSSSLAIESAQDQARDTSTILVDLTTFIPTLETPKEAARVTQEIFDPTSGVLARVTDLVGAVSRWVQERVPPGTNDGPAYELWHRLGQASEDLWDIAEALGSTSDDLAELPATALVSPRAQAARAVSPTAPDVSGTATTTAPAAPAASSPDRAPTR
ncbi:hypothetical protein ACFXJ5_08970 [Streptomyces sp. NPDC059373]